MKNLTFLEKIGAEKANVTNNEWILYNVNISRS